MIEPFSHPALVHLVNAESFICFARVWWDGDGLDTATWWKSGSNCRMRLAMTGETYEPKMPTTLVDAAIDAVDFDRVVDEFLTLGIGRLPHQPKRVALTHHDTWYGIKYPENSVCHWVGIAGGIHALPEAFALLSCVYKYFPALMPSSTVAPR